MEKGTKNNAKKVTGDTDLSKRQAKANMALAES